MISLSQRFIACLTAVAALSAFGLGCGGGSGSGGEGSARIATGSEEHHDSGTGAAQFETKGGDNSIQHFGGEGSGSDIEDAAPALHGYLDARAAGEWGKACSFMARGVTRSLSQLAAGDGGKGTGCPKALAGLSGSIPVAVLRETAVADVGALRVEGARAFLLFHGAKGIEYFIPMVRERGDWLVAAIAPTALS